MFQNNQPHVEHTMTADFKTYPFTDIKMVSYNCRDFTCFVWQAVRKAGRSRGGVVVLFSIGRGELKWTKASLFFYKALEISHFLPHIKTLLSGQEKSPHRS